MKPEKRLTVLVCPLDWGLGHASRDILLIKELINESFNVILGGEGSSMQLLHQEFPSLKTVNIPSVKITYSRSDSMVFKMIRQMPVIIKGIIKEHAVLKNLIQKNNIDLVISDNRFGLWSRSIYSIYITHQLWIKFPGALRIFEWPVYLMHRLTISRYDECWIPDTDDPDFNLSGKLAHINGFPRHGSFAGIFSRFMTFSNSLSSGNNIEKETDILVIISGPEPQRTIFEELLVNRLKDMPYNALIIRGLPFEQETQSSYDNIRLKNHLSAGLFYYLLKTSKYIFCRSGYSTLMDLAAVERRAILIPTPGQTEQEYLADYFSDKYGFVVCSQKHLDLKKAIQDYDLTVQNDNFNFDVNTILKGKIRSLKAKLVELKNIKDNDHGNQT